MSAATANAQDVFDDDPDGRQALSLRLVKAMNEGKLERTGRPEGF